MTDALFDINDDGEDHGFDADPLDVLTLRLRTQPSTATTVRFQVFDPDGFDPELDPISNPPLAASGSPDLLLDNGIIIASSVSPETPAGEVTCTLPATDGHAWIFRCIVDGGYSQVGDRLVLDPSLIHERIVVIRDASGRRPLIPTETNQYDPVYGWTTDVGLGGPTGPTGPAGASSSFRRIRTEIYRTDGSLETIDADGNSVITTSSTFSLQSDGHRYRVWVAAGAPGGGRGGRTAAANTSGVGGSGGGSMAEEWFDRDVLEDIIAALGTPIPVVVGAGGASIAAGSQGGGNSNQVAGNPGAESSFGTLCVAYPGAVGVTAAAGPNRGGGGGGVFNAAGGVNFLGGQPQDIFASNTSTDNTFGGGTGGTESTSQPAGASVEGGGGGGSSRTAGTAGNGFAGGRSIRGGGGSGASGGAQTAGSARAGGAGGKSGYQTGNGAMSNTSTGGVGGGGTSGTAGTGANAGDGGDGANGIIGLRCGDGGGGGGGLLVNSAGTFTSGAGGDGGFPGGAGGPSGSACVNGPGTGAAAASGKGGDGVVAVFTYG